MTDILNHVTGMGFDLLQALLGVGLVIALGKVVLGHRDGCRHSIGIAVVAIIVALWRAGQLGSLFASFIQQLTSGGSAPPVF